MCSKQFSKNCPKYCVIAKILHPVGNWARRAHSNLSLNFQTEVDIWSFLHMHSRKLAKCG